MTDKYSPTLQELLAWFTVSTKNITMETVLTNYFTDERIKLYFIKRDMHEL